MKQISNFVVKIKLLKFSLSTPSRHKTFFVVVKHDLWRQMGDLLNFYFGECVDAGKSGGGE